MSKGKKPAERIAEATKDAKDALDKLEKQVRDTLNELEKLRPARGQVAKSVDEIRKVAEDRISQFRSLIDKYIADVHISGDLKSDFEKLRSQLPELTSKLQESIRKQAASMYADRIKVFGDDLKSSLKRLRERIGY